MSVLDQIQNPSADPGSPPTRDRLPGSLLYATSARLGGTGLDTTSLHGALAGARAGILRKAVAYENRQHEIPAGAVRSLRAAPVRLASFLPSQRYYAAKKRYLDLVTAQMIRRRGREFDCFHGWSGDCVRTLIAARQRGIPSLLDIPTWHRNKGKTKPFLTKSEREARAARGWRRLRHGLTITRQQALLEYELADVILVPSEKSAETFLDAGVPSRKLFYLGRGVDPDAYQPAQAPPLFRLVFVGALIRRKGVHHLLEAWKRLDLPDAELVLVGASHPEIRPALDEFATDSVRLCGFSANVGDELGAASAFVFPSECEGAAKAVLEAAACGLPLITTRESGDVAVDGETGLVIPPNDVDALADAIGHLHRHPDLLPQFGEAARKRVVENFTWDHYRARLLNAYAYACS